MTVGLDAAARPGSSQADRQLATLCELGAAFVLAFVDAMVKWLVADYPIVRVAWVRMGVRVGQEQLAVARIGEPARVRAGEGGMSKPPVMRPLAFSMPKTGRGPVFAFRSGVGL